MDLLRADQAKIRILKHLLIKEEMTLNELREAVGGVNFVSVKRSCTFLEKLGIVQIERRPVGKRRYSWVRLTDAGKSLAVKIARS